MVKIIYAIDSIHRNMPSGNGVQAVRTTFQILHALHDMEGSAGVSELSRELDLPVSTVHSHLTTLHECEYVVKRDTKYDIGYRFLETGGRRRSRSRLYQFAKPKVDQLAAELGDKVKVREGNKTRLQMFQGVVIDRKGSAIEECFVVDDEMTWPTRRNACTRIARSSRPWPTSSRNRRGWRRPWRRR